MALGARKLAEKAAQTERRRTEDAAKAARREKVRLDKLAEEEKDARSKAAFLAAGLPEALTWTPRPQDLALWMKALNFRDSSSFARKASASVAHRSRHVGFVPREQIMLKRYSKAPEPTAAAGLVSPPWRHARSTRAPRLWPRPCPQGCPCSSSGATPTLSPPSGGPWGSSSLRR